MIGGSSLAQRGAVRWYENLRANSSTPTSLGRDLNGWRLSGEFIECNFTGAKLRDAEFSGTFVGCSFLRADQRGAKRTGIFRDNKKQL